MTIVYPHHDYSLNPSLTIYSYEPHAAYQSLPQPATPGDLLISYTVLSLTHPSLNPNLGPYITLEQWNPNPGLEQKEKYKGRAIIQKRLTCAGLRSEVGVRLRCRLTLMANEGPVSLAPTVVFLISTMGVPWACLQP